MVIKDKTVFVYDIECFPNLFVLTIKNTESGISKVFEISCRKNEIIEICNLFRYKNIMFCGYNVIHYDNVIIHYILTNLSDLLDKHPLDICYILKKVSDELIDVKDWKFSTYSKYKYMSEFDTLDLLTMMFSNKLRVGLKELQVTMQYHNVQEYDGDFNEYIPEKEIDNAISYCFNDINSTEELLNRLQKDIELRLSIEKEYGIKALNKDGVNLGMEILKQRYLEETDLSWKDIRDLRSPCDKVCLDEIIFPFIKFKTKVLQDLLIDLKNQCVNPDDREFERTFIIGNVKHTLALGGLHSQNKPETFEPTENQLLLDIDVQAMYPSIILEHKIYPPHLGEAFLKVYGKIKEERVEAKKAGNKLKDSTLKLSINGLSGNLQSEYSWVYSPKTVLQVRMNGQLMLLMLIEECVLASIQLVNSNTDGIYIMLDKSQYPKLQEICKDWENKTKLILEEDRFERFYQFAINDYLGVKEGYSATKDPKYLKKKGLFIDSVTLGKGMAPMIIPEAINKYLADGVDPNKTVTECKDILKFCTYQKVAKKFKVLYGDQEVQHINRYYMSTNGKYIVKKDPNDFKRKPTALCASSPVTIYNKVDNIEISDRKINYAYYLKEIKKILNALDNPQLSLF